MDVTRNNALQKDLASLSRSARWLMSARPKTLGLSVVPVLAGTWIAALSGAFRPDVLGIAIFAACAIQIGTNLWNDAADAKRGTDGPDRLGPPRMTSVGLLEARHVFAAARLAFLCAAGAGLYLTWLGGWPILILGLLSLATGYLYSMGPWPLSASPFGEILVVAFFGIAAVTGTAHLHGMAPDGQVILLGLIIGLPAAAVLLVNNHRDRNQDAASGRRTLAILIGVAASRVLFALLLLCAAGGSFAFAPPSSGRALIFTPVLLLAFWLIRAMFRLPVSARLNRLIPATSVFQALCLAAMAGSDIVL